MNEWQSRGVAEGGFVEEEVTGWRPRGWLRVCQGNKEGRSVLGSVDSMGEGMGGVESVAHLGHWEAFSEAGRGAAGGEGGSGWLCGAGRDKPEAPTAPRGP